MITAAEIAMTVYSSHGVADSPDDSGWPRAQVYEGHRGGDPRTKRDKPDHRARAEQDAVHAIELAGIEG